MDKLTLVKVLDIINSHLEEVKNLPGNPIGKEPVLTELQMLKDDIKKLLR